MKQILMLVIILLVVISCSNKVESNDLQEVILTCDSIGSFPEVMGDSSGFNWDHPGVVPEMLKLVEQKAGVKFIFRRQNWKTALENDLKNDLTNGLFTVSYKKEREAYGVYPKTGDSLQILDADKCIYYYCFKFYKNKSSQVAWDGHMLTNFNGIVGVTRQYLIGNDLQSMGYIIDESDYALKNLKKVADGRLEICAEFEDHAKNILANQPELLNLLEEIEQPLVNKPLYLMLSKQFVAKYPEVAQKIWSSLSEIRKSDYERILLKYVK